MAIPAKLKKVKIDEHIRKSKKQSPGQPGNTTKKRGRPPKTSNESVGIGSAEPGPLAESVSTDPTGNPPLTPEIVPEYDTTAEARAVLAAPFGVISALSGVQEVALTEPELDASVPSFRAVYDKHLRPFIGENAEVYAFGLVFAGLLAKKYQAFVQSPVTQARRARAKAESETVFTDPLTKEERAAT